MASLMLWLPLVVLRPLLARRAGLAVDALIVVLGLAMLQRQDLAPIAAPAWRWVPAYPLLAGAAFVLSVWLTTVEPGAYLRRVAAGLGRAGAGTQRKLLGLALLTAVHEELVWRCIAQPALGAHLGSVGAVAVVALAFAFLHRHRTGANLPRIVEMSGFALLLGSLYALTADPLLVILVHATRNYFIYIGQLNREKP